MASLLHPPHTLTPSCQVFGRRLAAFWASVILAVFILFQVYCITYHDEVLSAQSAADGSGDGSSSRRRRMLQAPPDASAVSDSAPTSCPASGDIPLILLMFISSAYFLFQFVLAFLNGIMFTARPIDSATHHFGAVAPRISLLQQTSPFWDFQKRIQQALKSHAHDAAVADGLIAALQPIALQPLESSAMDVADDDHEHSHPTGALLSFVDLLNVRAIRHSPLHFRTSAARR
jgi:hypothetical protein